MSEKIEILFNDEPIQVEKGARLIEVCAERDLEIPRFCYHPGLSVVASCRMCQVEVEGPGKAPRRPAVACRTECLPTMKVWTNTEAAHAARQDVLEFLLKNHPLDCPICDKAGECPLQNYTYAEGQSAGRTNEPRRSWRKRVDLGDVILLDEERCVLCSRCVRFCDEVDKDPQLMVRGRGVESMVGTLEDAPLHGNYQGNLADICPVGALTLKKFRFQARVWNLQSTDSICPRCTRGCNIKVDTHRGRTVRIRPRHNKEVNGYWMCDIGRFTFEDLNIENRLRRILIHQDGAYSDPGWGIALDQTAAALARSGSALLAVASPYLTNEEGAGFAKLCQALEVTPHFLIPKDTDPDHLLYTGEIGPNRKGLEAAGLTPLPIQELAGKWKPSGGLYLAGEHIWEFAGGELGEKLADSGLVILQDTVPVDRPGIDILIGAATWAEKSGTFTNQNGIKQALRPAMRLPDGVRLDRTIFEDLCRSVEKGAGMEVEAPE